MTQSRHCAIPMSSPDITDLEVDAVVGVLRRGEVSQGGDVGRFEAAFAETVSRRFAIAVSSGTTGLHLAMEASGVDRGDLVLTTPFSFVASSNCILYQGGIPVFCDVEPASGNLDAEEYARIASDLASGGPAAQKRLPPSLRRGSHGPLRAVLPVHVFGRLCDMDRILSISQEHDCRVVEDACEALGTESPSGKAGALGDVSVFGFYANKQISTGEGGMIVTDREDWDLLFRSLRNQGRLSFGPHLEHDRLGFNYRMDGLSAALGLAQLKRLEELLSKRRRVAQWYRQRLVAVEELQLPRPPRRERISWFAYVVRLQTPVQRDLLIEGLAADGIPSRAYFEPIHLQKFYREAFGFRPGDFPVAEHLGKVSLALPFSSVMDEGQVDRVCRRLLSILRSPSGHLQVADAAKESS